MVIDMNERLKEVVTRMPDNDVINDTAELFKVLGDQTRVKILTALEVKELCVGEIAECLEMTKSAVSHQLRILRQSKLVKARKSGKEVYYSLADEHVSLIISVGKEHILEEK